MKVKKVFNNNILLAEDEQMLETVLMGKGIGFAIHPMRVRLIKFLNLILRVFKISLLSLLMIFRLIS